jgi:DMSO/TMAO reductase YedYZ heme-binding membrane subunit
VAVELNPQAWWYLARASGFTAWALSLASIFAGMALATRALGNKPRPAWLLDIHRYTGGLTVAFVAVHLAALVADSYVSFGLADLLVPMASDWRPGAVAWGVVALWLLIAVEVSSLAMRRIPRRVWRAVHLSSYVVGVAATVHVFAAGTDAGNRAVVLIALLAAALTVFFLVYRVLMPKSRRRAARVVGRTSAAC